METRNAAAGRFRGDKSRASRYAIAATRGSRPVAWLQCVDPAGNLELWFIRDAFPVAAPAPEEPPAKRRRDAAWGPSSPSPPPVGWGPSSPDAPPPSTGGYAPAAPTGYAPEPPTGDAPAPPAGGSPLMMGYAPESTGGYAPEPPSG